MHLNDHGQSFHRTPVAGEHIWSLSAPSTGTAESARAVCLGPCPVRVWICPRKETPQSQEETYSSFLVPSKKKGFFLMFKWNFLYLNLCFFPVPWYWEDPAVSSLLPPIRCLHMLIRSLLSFLFSRLNIPISLSLSTPLIIIVALSSSMSMSHLSQRAQDWTPDLFHQCWIQRKNQFPWPAGNALPNAAQEVVHFLFCKGTHSGLKFVSSRTPGSFTRTLSSSWLVPSLYWRIRLFLLWYRTSPFLFVTIPPSSLLQPAEIPLKGNTNNWCINHSFHFTTICKLSGY